MLRESLIFAWKDLKIEFRTKQMLNIMVIFVLLIILAFKFALSNATVETKSVAPAILWITFTFAGMYGLTTSFAKEKDMESLSALLLAPTERCAIYLGKVFSNLITLFIIEIAALVIFSVFFSYNIIGEIPLLVLVIILGTIGFVVIGTIISAISVNTKSREVLLPIMLIPLIIFTILMPAITATGKIFDGGTFFDIFDEIRLLVTFNIIYFIVSMVLSEFVLEE